MLNLELHEDWHCAQCLLAVCKAEPGEPWAEFKERRFEKMRKRKKERNNREKGEKKEDDGILGILSSTHRRANLSDRLKDRFRMSLHGVPCLLRTRYGSWKSWQKVKELILILVLCRSLPMECRICCFLKADVRKISMNRTGEAWRNYLWLQRSSAQSGKIMNLSKFYKDKTRCGEGIKSSNGNAKYQMPSAGYVAWGRFLWALTSTHFATNFALTV